MMLKSNKQTKAWLAEIASKQLAETQRETKAAKNRAAHRRYNLSAKGIARNKRYAATEKGRLRQERYDHSYKGVVRRSWLSETKLHGGSETSLAYKPSCDAEITLES